MRIKEELKKNPVIVGIYDTIFGGMHKLSYRTAKKIKWIKARLTTRMRFCYGNKNKDKTFFVISSNAKEMGFYSTIFCIILPCIEYAVKRNYIPVIDLSKTFLKLLQDEEKRGLENPWEYYYEQPFNQYTLEEVYQSKHVIMADRSLLRINIPNWNEMFPIDDEKELAHWNKIITSYIRLNKELESKLAIEHRKIFKEGYKVLGVGVRAGYRAIAMQNIALMNNHPKQPTCEELIKIVKEKMKEWGCHYVFLSCDDREYVNKFISSLGDKCCYMQRRLKHYFENDMPVLDVAKGMIEYEGSSIRETTEEYIIETCILSQCDSLYSSIGGGSEFAYYLNGGHYEHVEIWNDGIYGGLGR